MSFSVRFSSVTNAKMEDKTRRQREAERVRGRPSVGRAERPLAAQARVRVYDRAGGRGRGDGENEVCIKYAYFELTPSLASRPPFDLAN